MSETASTVASAGDGRPPRPPAVRSTLSRLSAALLRVVARVGGEGADGDDRRKRSFLVVALTALIPALLAFALSDLGRGEAVAALPALGLALVLSATLALARRLRRVERAARVIFAVALLCLARAIVTGGADGYAVLWSYLLPIWVFFLFNWREGALWAALAGVTATGALLAGPLPYPASLVTRFVVTYLLVTLFSYALESTRDVAAHALQLRQCELEEALRKIKTLTGLLPICCSCKKIRNDRGAWSRLEDYLKEHTQAELTHGICPECMGELYPEIAKRMGGHPQRVPASSPLQPPPL